MPSDLVEEKAIDSNTHTDTKDKTHKNNSYVPLVVWVIEKIV